MPNKKTPVKAAPLPVPVELIERRIYLIRDLKVMLDADLAELYQVPTFRLNEAVKRNRNRFPEDFMLQLTQEEAGSLTSQIAMSNGRGGRRTLPYVFTEHGVAMLSSVLTSDRAVCMNISIIRAFVKLREMVATNKDLSGRMEKLEATQKQHGSVITIVVDEIEKLRAVPPPAPRRRIGYGVPERRANA